jgi:DNA (cytosine-5)-methyltransferase 1
MHPHRYIAIDLFSGCGGLSLGLRRAGFLVAGAVDVDALSIETYQKNHRGVAVWNSDIRTLAASDVMQKLGIAKGQLDLLAGCPPCQGFSSLRTMNASSSIDDPRNDLVFDFLRFVKEMLPKTVMMENVPGLIHDYRMTLFLNSLKKLGYKCSSDVFDAAEYSVPQRRRRMLLIAGRVSEIGFAKPAKLKLTVRSAIGNLPLPGSSGDPMHDFPEKRSARVLTLIKKIPKDGGGRISLSADEQLDCHRRCSGFRDIYGRLAWDQVSPTITSGCTNPSKGRFLHPEQDRALTLREAALLQGFPQNYFFSLRRGKGLASVLIGNALPPNMIKRHAVKVRKYLDSIDHHAG